MEEAYINEEFQEVDCKDVNEIKTVVTNITKKIIDIRAFKNSEKIYVVGIYEKKLNLSEMSKVYTVMRVWSKNNNKDYKFDLRGSNLIR